MIFNRSQARVRVFYRILCLIVFVLSIDGSNKIIGFSNGNSGRKPRTRLSFD